MYSGRSDHPSKAVAEGVMVVNANQKKGIIKIVEAIAHQNEDILLKNTLERGNYVGDSRRSSIPLLVFTFLCIPPSL